MLNVDSAIIVDLDVHVFLFGRACLLNKRGPARFPARPSTPGFLSIIRKTHTVARQVCMGLVRSVGEALRERLPHHTSGSADQRSPGDKSSADESPFEAPCPNRTRL